MNYRHVYHAGNFADVFKHAILALCVDYLKQKPAPFRVIDTHAGLGLYDLAGVEAGKTLEWADGIGRLIGAEAEPLPPAIAEILAPYLGVLARRAKKWTPVFRETGAPHYDSTASGDATSSPDAVDAPAPGTGLAEYPGSPMIVRRLMRPGDALIVNELHPADVATLAALFAKDAQTKVLALDGWTALKALLPPKERRGLVLIDPPFEARDDFEKLAASVVEARRRFATGTFLLWYPVKDPKAADAFYEAVREAAGDKALRTELLIRAPQDVLRLNGCGMLIINPPWTLQAKLRVLLPFLAERLARAPGASWRAETC